MLEMNLGFHRSESQAAVTLRQDSDQTCFFTVSSRQGQDTLHYERSSCSHCPGTPCKITFSIDEYTEYGSRVSLLDKEEMEPESHDS